jgi:hypothetical protein
MPDKICPKCGTTMQEGFVVDNTYGGNLQAQWAEGKPNYSFWTGLKIAKDAKHAISTFRCEGCGFLESYAAVE